MKKSQRTFLLLRVLLGILGKLALAICLMIWDTLLWVIEFVDGGDDQSRHREDPGPYYNYLTGELDPVKHWDGIYDHNPSHHDNR